MWRSPPDDELDGIRHEVHRARRRWNAYVVQGCVYVAVAIVAVTALLVLAVALVAAPTTFLVTLAGATIGCLTMTVRSTSAAWRAWLRKAQAPLWVDRQAAMDGRLATLLALGPGGPTRLRPLLLETTVARRRAFAPEKLVPSPVPLARLAAAACALASLPLGMRLAPLLEPQPLVVAEAGGTRVTQPVDGAGDVIRRFEASRAPTDATERAASRGAPDDETTRPMDGGLAASLQSRIRRQLWGERWARAGATSPDASRARAGAADARATPRAGETRDAGSPDAARRAAVPPEAAETSAGGAASGAGRGTDPHLFGTETSAEPLDDGRFALGLAARVRTIQTGPRPPSGDAPEAEPDARPTLAARQRPDAPAHRAAIPPAFAAIVRDAFAHRPPQGDPAP